MAMMTEGEARDILERTLKFSKADEANAGLNGSDEGNIRFALNEVTTSGAQSDTSLSVQSSYSKRTGVSTVNAFDDASLERVVRRSEELAKLAPENPEFVAQLPKQTYKATDTWAESIAKITPEYRADVARRSIDPAVKADSIAAGFLSDARSFTAHMNSNGNFGYQRYTDLNYTCTVRTEDGKGSGWVGRSAAKVSDFNVDQAIGVAVNKAVTSREAKALEPGKYTVILEPHAVAGLLNYMMFSFDARQADEGRSFLSKKGGGNRMGDKLFDERVSITADPWDARVPVLPWDGEGRPREKVTLVDEGKISYLQYSRYWAGKNGVPGSGQFGNIIMAGGTKTTEELVADTKRGILVSRTWYIRMVDPQTVLLTGLTRDGTFYIEDGKIKHAVKNFRFNESPVIMLNNISELGRPIRVEGDESSFSMLLPPMRIDDFTFTSLSDAV